ncbi:MAG: hypothetical protein KJ737_10665 [Proteobacteria bacterium]|nr:hypothetical protein [Pseudomonadota bacterium]
MKNVFNICIDSYGRNQKRLHEIIGGRMSVLPPDSKHADYEVIPVTIADGCLYRCAFCSVKSGRKFQARSLENISVQLSELKKFYGTNLQNLNAIFIGNHDGLAAGKDAISFAAIRAYAIFGFNKNAGGPCTLFLFGSVLSFFKAEDSLFDMLNRLPYKTYINLGLEAFHGPTLTQLGKANLSRPRRFSTRFTK